MTEHTFAELMFDPDVDDFDCEDELADRVESGMGINVYVPSVSSLSDGEGHDVLELPLTCAIRARRDGVARQLVKLGACVDGHGTLPHTGNATSFTVNYTTPLGVAVGLGRLEMVRLLINAGADVHIHRIHPVDKHFTPLHLAAANDDAPMVATLIAAGADPYHPDKGGSHMPIYGAIVAHASEATAALAPVHHDMEYALLLECVNQKSPGCLKALIDNGYNPLSRQTLNSQPLIVTAVSRALRMPPERYKADMGWRRIFELLIDAGADINEPGPDGKTALQRARQARNPILGEHLVALSKRSRVDNALQSAHAPDDDDGADGGTTPMAPSL